MSLVGFVLECGAIAALVGTAVGLLAVGTLLATRPLTASLSAAVRCDLALVLALLPALAAISMVVTAAAPSVANVLGLGPDHCLGHEHHLHICFIHSAGLRPALATIGAFAMAVWTYRLGSLLNGAIQLSGTSRILERLARVRGGRFPVFFVPGARLCHATGLVRRRIMLSSELAEQLSPDQLASALAHEEAHLQRRDPLASFILAGATLFVPPPLGEWLRRIHRQTAEEACDAAAAHVIGDGVVVAGALVKVAALQRETRDGASLAAPAFGRHGLESRVKALLAPQLSASSRSHWGFLALVATASFAVLAYLEAELLHHGAETVLGSIF